MLPQRYKVKGLFVEEAPAQQLTQNTGTLQGRPPVLLLHGACHGAWCWENWLTALPKKGWHTYTMALRNHPGSWVSDREAYCQRTFIADYIEDLAIVTAHIGRTCVIVGHSMGGLIAQKYMEILPNGNKAESGMVLVASGAPGFFGTGNRAPLPEDKPVLFDKEVAANYFYSKAPPEVLDRAIQRLVGESPSVMNEYSQPPGIEIDPARITCPSLVISAALDRTIVPHDNRLAEFFKADYHLAKDIGHGLMLETGWEKVLDVVVAWLEQHFPGSHA